MDHHDDNFDECFIGEFSVGEMNSAAKEILKRQDEAKRTVFVHMIKKSVLLLVAVILLIFLLMNFTDLAKENMSPTRIHRSYDPTGPVGIIRDFLMIPLLIYAVIIFAVQIIRDCRRLYVYGQYKVYKGKITEMSEVNSPEEDGAYLTEIALADGTSLKMNYNFSAEEASALDCGSEIILVDFIGFKPMKRSNKRAKRKNHYKYYSCQKYIIIRADS